MSDPEYLGMDTMPSTGGFMEKKRYKISYRCNVCGHEYSRITTRLDKVDPPCPTKACKEAVFKEAVQREVANMAKMLNEQRPPAHTGANTNIKAVDMTAEIVMKDHNLTDLKDNVRQGESMAPRLRPDMQRAADSFFNPSTAMRNKRQAVAAQRLGQRAIAGAFRNTAIDPVNVLGGNRGEPALRKVRDEPLR